MNDFKLLGGFGDRQTERQTDIFTSRDAFATENEDGFENSVLHECNHIFTRRFYCKLLGSVLNSILFNEMGSKQNNNIFYCWGTKI